MARYTIKTTFGETVQFEADLTQASAPIEVVLDDGETRSTPYQTADAHHRADQAAVLVMRDMGRDFWDDGSWDGEDQDEYIEGLIKSVD